MLIYPSVKIAVFFPFFKLDLIFLPSNTATLLTDRKDLLAFYLYLF